MLAYNVTNVQQCANKQSNSKDKEEQDFKQADMGVKNVGFEGFKISTLKLASGISKNMQQASLFTKQHYWVPLSLATLKTSGEDPPTESSTSYH